MMKQKLLITKIILTFSLFFSLSIMAQWEQVGTRLEGVSDSAERYGYAVSISGDGNTMAVGAYKDGEVFNETYGWLDERGSVKIYEKETTNGTWVLKTELVGLAPGEHFGRSLSLSSDGSLLIVGAPNAGNGVAGEWNVDSDKTGVVRVYESDESGTWTQKGIDIEGGTVGEGFGWAVDISDDGINFLASSYKENSTYDTEAGAWTRFYEGSAKVYTFEKSTWFKAYEISEAEAEDGTGYTVSISQDGFTAAVSSQDHDSEKGTTRVYRNINDTWTQIGTDIDGETAGDESGTSISLSEDGNTLAIGAPNYNSNDGITYIYIYENSVWTKSSQIVGTQSAGNKFGSELALTKDGTTLAVTGISNDSSNGAVKVYKNDASTWTQVGNDVVSGATAYSFIFFGSGLDISEDGNTIAVGAYAVTIATGGYTTDGAVYTYTYTESDDLSVKDLFVNDVLYTVSNGTVYAAASHVNVYVYSMLGKTVDNKNLKGLYIVQFVDQESNSTISKKILFQ